MRKPMKNLSNFSIVATRKIWYTLSAVLVGLSIIAIAVFGFVPGIDFTGGALLEVEYEARPEVQSVRDAVDGLAYVNKSVVQEVDENAVLLRLPFLSVDEHKEVVGVLEGLSEQGMEEVRYETIGPSISSELRSKSIWSITIVVIAIILFIAFAFRKVNKPVSSWKYGLAAIVALIHDVLIPSGIVAVLGRFAGFEVDTLFVVALLTILGFSVNDTIVTFDRIRENLLRHPHSSFEDNVDLSIQQTITRSINTSITTLFAMVAIYFFGGETVKDFMLVLIIGTVIGTYSSIFLASPFLTEFARMARKEK